VKLIFTPAAPFVEAAVAYAWLALGYQAAGRVLIFYLWCIAIFLFFIAGIVGSANTAINLPLPKRSVRQRALRFFMRVFVLVRVLGLSAVGYPVLAGVYFLSVLLAIVVLEARAKEQKATAE
jgi:hypothetical protein